jgi:hypothetical protein
MKRIHLLFKIPAVGLAGFCALASICANIRAQEIEMRGPTLLFKNEEKFDPSAVEPIGDGTYLLVADDDTTPLLIVDAKTREIIPKRLEIPDFQASNPDWEAMAKDSENNYYLIGSHSHLLRFRLKDEMEKDPAKIKIECKIDIDIKEFFDSLQGILKGHSPQIEGLAVWRNGGKKELVVGVREKGSKTIHVYHSEFADDKLHLKLLFHFIVPEVENAKNVEWHLSSIEYVPAWDGFLVITSTEEQDKFYGSMLWFVSNEMLKGLKQSSTEVTPDKSKVFEPTMKAEGLAVLPSTDKAKLRVIIVFDNDSRKAAALAFADLSKPVKMKPKATPNNSFKPTPR